MMRSESSQKTTEGGHDGHNEEVREGRYGLRNDRNRSGHQRFRWRPGGLCEPLRRSGDAGSDGGANLGHEQHRHRCRSGATRGR